MHRKIKYESHVRVINRKHKIKEGLVYSKEKLD